VGTNGQQTAVKRGPYAFEYARIAVTDPAASADFYERHVGLDVSGRKDGRVYLRAGTEHHCIELVKDGGVKQARVTALGFSIDSEEALAEIKGRVKAAGHPVKPLDEAQKAVCTDGFATSDPTGMTLELFTEFQVFAEPPMLEYRPVCIVHPFLGTEKYDETLKFYLEVIGFRASDYIANVSAFLRSENRFHHSLAMRRSKAFEIAHVCFQMKSFDHMMRGRAKAIYHKVKIGADMANHSGSRSLAFYMEDPAHGPKIELCDGHEILTPEEHETRKPRRMSIDPRNIDVWRAAEDDWADL
jgi:2,3-dihydroxy-p-cumate/2,3-dihydroxybenzoate 3,4-dioxygenase